MKPRLIFYSEYLSRLLVLTTNVSQLILARHILITHLCLRFILFIKISIFLFVLHLSLCVCEFCFTNAFLLLFLWFLFPREIGTFCDHLRNGTNCFLSRNTSEPYSTITYSTMPQHNSQCCVILFYTIIPNYQGRSKITFYNFPLF